MGKGKEYLERLGKAYERKGMKEQWDHLLEIATGITEEDKAKLLEIYPDLPPSLMEILEVIDGTYWRMYGDEEVTGYFFGSDVDRGSYPYYLFSAQDILENTDNDYSDLIYYALEEPEDFGDSLDEKIDAGNEHRIWLNFSDCMNNGGSSKLYVDFTPSELGKKGQIVRFLHDPDELRVISDSFDDFLDMLMEHDFQFVDPEDKDWFFHKKSI